MFLVRMIRNVAMRGIILIWMFSSVSVSDQTFAVNDHPFDRGAF